MMRFLGVLILGLVVAAGAHADLLPPGTKNIPIDHKFETDKEYSDWVFFIVEGSGGVAKAKLDPKTPLVIKGSSGVGNGPVPQPGAKPRIIPYRAAALFAVPKDAAAAYKTEKELHAAIEDNKVTGMHAVNGHFFDHENAKATDPRKAITKRYKITKVDAKTGVTLEPITDDSGAGKKKEEEEAAAQPIFTWIAVGLSVAAVLGFTGLLLAGRSRRREMGS
jgi:hypothetical protein